MSVKHRILLTMALIFTIMGFMSYLVDNPIAKVVLGIPILTLFSLLLVNGILCVFNIKGGDKLANWILD